MTDADGTISTEKLVSSTETTTSAEHMRSSVPDITKFDPHMLQRLQKNWRLTPATFAHKISQGRWVPAKHLMYISARIAVALAKKNGRLIVSMPPRHGKSELLSKYVPIYTLEHRHDARVILASYGGELATDYGRQVRDTINSNKDILDVQIRADKQQIAHFVTLDEGAMYSVGRGGSITGRGADVFLIDDYIKNLEQAESEAQREKIYEGFKADMSTRLEPGASIIILATRWNVDDLIGRLLQDFPEEWEFIRLPALAEEDDPLGREVGEPLWPERYDLAALLKIKKTLGDYLWQALYQQKPIPRSMGLVHDSWFMPVESLPQYAKLRKVRAWDLAGTDSGGDYTVGALLAVDRETGLFYIIDVIRDQWGPADIERIVRQVAELDGRDVPIVIEQEVGAAGKALISYYSRKILKGFEVKGVLPSGPKVIRARPMFSFAEAGNIRMIKAPWNRAMLDEMKLFPDGSYDDQVDVISSGFHYLNEDHYRGVTFGRKKKDDAIRGTIGGLLSLGVTFGRSRQ